MWKKNSVITIFVLFIACLNVSFASDCSDDVIIVRDKKFNITEIKKVGKITTTLNGEDLEFSVCKPLKGTCGYFHCYEENEYSGCLQEFDGSFCLGLPKKSPFKLISGGFSISHERGDYLRDDCFNNEFVNMTINVMCDKSITGTPKVLFARPPKCKPCDDNPKCVPTIISTEYEFTIAHRSGCALGRY